MKKTMERIQKNEVKNEVSKVAQDKLKGGTVTVLKICGTGGPTVSFGGD